MHSVRRLGLRTRLTVSFALGAALLSAVLAIITWSLTRENLLSQRDDSAFSLAEGNAVTLSGRLSGSGIDYTALLGAVPTPEGAQPVLWHGDWWANNSAEFSQNDLPPAVVDAVESGSPARQRFEVDGRPWLAVGVPIASSNAMYFESVPLTEVERTLDGLGISLLGAGAITTLAGGLLGFWASRRVLVPLASFGRAAEAIAGGRLDTRLRTGTDPDLDPLIVSFNDMASALQSRVERDARFASEVSHELRSPLMTLAASVEVLENSRGHLSERAQRALDLLTADVDRFQQLVQDLLEISRFDVGAITLHLQPVPVTEMVRQVVGAAGGDRLPVRYPPGLSQVAVLVDKTRFFRVVANLLENADRYAGGATGVDIDLVDAVADEDGTPERPKVRIAVEDAGHGVPESERELIFDRFSRGTAGGNRGADSGTGLGLALVDEHVRLHGGRVWVEERHDGKAGARFVIELPALLDDDELPDDELPVTVEELNALGVTEPAPVDEAPSHAPPTPRPETATP
jgi:signal transduction histidine kinase